MKKILIATDGFLPRWDGIVRFLLEMVPRLEKDFEVKILAPKFPGDYQNPFDSEVVRFDLVDRPFGDIHFSRVRQREITEYIQWADLVFVQSLGSIGMGTIKGAKKQDKPVVAFLHVIEWELATKSIKRFKKPARLATQILAKHYYKKCDLLLAPSEEVVHIFEKSGMKVPKKIVNLGTDTRYFTPPQDKKEAKKNIGLDPEKTIIGYHGRIGREKNLHTLYRAFRRIEKRHSDVKLMIVGKGVKDVEEMFTSARNIIMPGPKQDIASYLQALDIYVMPSLTETTSLAVLEAMSTGLPVIATPAGSVKDYITERENGMVFPFRNSMRLSMKIELLLKDKDLMEKLGENARDTVKESFSWDQTYAQLKETLSNFLRE